MMFAPRYASTTPSSTSINANTYIHTYICTSAYLYTYYVIYCRDLPEVMAVMRAKSWYLRPLSTSLSYIPREGA